MRRPSPPHPSRADSLFDPSRPRAEAASVPSLDAKTAAAAPPGPLRARPDRRYRPSRASTPPQHTHHARRWPPPRREPPAREAGSRGRLERPAREAALGQPHFDVSRVPRLVQAGTKDVPSFLRAELARLRPLRRLSADLPRVRCTRRQHPRSLHSLRSPRRPIPFQPSQRHQLVDILDAHLEAALEE